LPLFCGFGGIGHSFGPDLFHRPVYCRKMQPSLGASIFRLRIGWLNVGHINDQRVGLIQHVKTMFYKCPFFFLSWRTRVACAPHLGRNHFVNMITIKKTNTLRSSLKLFGLCGGDTRGTRAPAQINMEFSFMPLD
jgi:hypothetical protein